MLLYQKEIECGYDSFLYYIFSHCKGEFILVFGKEKYKAIFDLLYEDENGLEDGDPNYDEYNTVLFKKEDNTFIEVNYLNLPDEIYHNGTLIFKKVEGELIEVLKQNFEFKE